jgi:drug/metabolite transporter (DMT)-like permease
VLGSLSAFLSSFTWAVGTSAYGRLSSGRSPFAINFTRALIALPLFFACALISLGGPTGLLEAGAQISGERWAWLALSMVASYGVGDALFMWSTRSLGVPAALAICSCYPLWTTLVGLVLGQAVDFARWLGVAVTLAGVVVVILSGAAHRAAETRGRRLGFLCAGLSSGFWALNSVAISLGASGLSPFLANSIRMALAMVIAGGLGRALTPRAPVVIPWRDLRPVLWMFVLEAFGGSVFFLYGLTHAPLAVAAVLSSLAPVISVPIAWMTLGERLNPRKSLGIVLTVVGIALLAF